MTYDHLAKYRDSILETLSMIMLILYFNNIIVYMRQDE